MDKGVVQSCTKLYVAIPRRYFFLNHREVSNTKNKIKSWLGPQEKASVTGLSLRTKKEKTASQNNENENMNETQTHRVKMKDREKKSCRG